MRFLVKWFTCLLFGHKWRPTIKPEWPWCLHCPRCESTVYCGDEAQFKRMSR